MLGLFLTAAAHFNPFFISLKVSKGQRFPLFFFCNVTCFKHVGKALLSLLFCAAIKEERFRFGNGYDQVEDVMGVAQPVRFNSKQQTFICSSPPGRGRC